MMLLVESDGQKIDPPGKREIKRTHSLLIDDLTTYQKNHRTLKMTNEILVQASMDTRAIYDEIVFKTGRIIKEEGLQILQERMNALDPNKNEIYRFLGCERPERIDIKKVMERFQIQMKHRTRKLVGEELYI